MADPAASKRTFAASHLDARPEYHTRQEWEARAQRLLDDGEKFLAYDHARVGLESAFPESLRLRQIAASALLQVGAVEEAAALIEPLCPDVGVRDGAVDRVFDAMRQAMGLLSPETGGSALDAQARDTMARFIGALDGAAQSLRLGASVDEETIGLLARIWKDRWKATGKPADGERARQLYARAFQQTGGYWTGINAAGVSRLLDGEAKFDRELAERVLRICEQQRPLVGARAAAGERAAARDLYWLMATQGEGSLLLGDEPGAVAHYREAADLARRHAWSEGPVSSLRQLRLYEDLGLSVPSELFALLRPPTVVAFVGHMIDRPDRDPPRFPAEAEPGVRQAIRVRVEALDARIGYCSAACGSDLLFIEAMLDRMAEVHVVLPFRLDDFIRESVAFAGEAWVARFRRALRLANSVKYVTQESYLDSDELFDLGAQIFRGFATLRARSLDTRPYLLAVWDGRTTPGLVGGTGDFVSKWSDPKRRQVIDLEPIVARVRATAPPPAPATIADPPAAPAVHAPPEGRRRPRVVKTLMFADLVGYSRLEEDQVPFFMHEFLQAIAGRLRRLPDQPRFINTWGDAIFAVMDRAMPLARYAIALRDIVRDTDWRGLGFADMSVRIALHAGPIYEGPDALTGRTNYYGSHVNRAARLEPVTVPGHVYASEQFAGLLLSEQSDPARADDDLQAEYVGTLVLAKGFGDLPVYHIRGRSNAAGSEAAVAT